MTTIARTNMCTNPSGETGTTGWSPLNATITNPTGFTSMVGRVGSYQLQLTATGTSYYMEASTPTISVSGGSWASFAARLWGENNVAQHQRISLVFANATGTKTYMDAPYQYVPFYTGGSFTVIAQAPSDAVSVYARVQSVSVDNVTVLASGQRLWWDAAIIQTGATQAAVSNTAYFDGSTAAVNSLAYQWTGTAGSSTSQEYYALPTVLTVAKTDAPCPRTEVTVVGLGTGTTVFNVWRTADGKRKAVRGARNRSGVDSDFVVDYEAPLNRSLTYDIEVISGSQVTQPTYPATVTVLSSTWWIQDPLVPSSAIPLNVSKQDSNAPYLTGNAIKSLDYGASVTLIPILGSTDPVALMGNRTIAGNVTFDMFTNLASVTTQLRNLIQQTPLLLIRSTGTRNNGIPGLAYFTSAKPSEKPVTVAFGGTLTNWSLTGDLVAAPTMNVLVPIWTYGTVAALWTTYQQAQTTLAAKTYLDVLKSPSGV